MCRIHGIRCCSMLWDILYIPFFSFLFFFFIIKFDVSFLQYQIFAVIRECSYSDGRRKLYKISSIKRLIAQNELCLMRAVNRYNIYHRIDSNIVNIFGTKVSRIQRDNFKLPFIRHCSSHVTNSRFTNIWLYKSFNRIFYFILPVAKVTRSNFFFKEKKKIHERFLIHLLLPRQLPILPVTKQRVNSSPKNLF